MLPPGETFVRCLRLSQGSSAIRSHCCSAPLVSKPDAMKGVVDGATVLGRLLSLGAECSARESERGRLFIF